MNCSKVTSTVDFTARKFIGGFFPDLITMLVIPKPGTELSGLKGSWSFLYPSTPFKELERASLTWYPSNNLTLFSFHNSSSIFTNLYIYLKGKGQLFPHQNLSRILVQLSKLNKLQKVTVFKLIGADLVFLFLIAIWVGDELVIPAINH